MKVISILFFSFFLVGNEPPKTDRRGFFTKIRDAYLEGRLSANEKRIAERVEAEKVRRRFWFERNINKLTDGLSKRLKSRPSRFWIYTGGTAAVIIWLCHKGSMGCDRDKDRD